MKRTYHTGLNITLQRGAVLSGRLFLFPILLGEGDDRNSIQEKDDENTAIDRPRTTGQSWQTLLSDGKTEPCRFREKSSSLRSGIFHESLALPGAFAVKPL